MQRRVPQVLRQIINKNSIAEDYFKIINTAERKSGIISKEYSRYSFEQSTSQQQPQIDQRISDLQVLVRANIYRIQTIQNRIIDIERKYETVQGYVEIIAKNQITLYLLNKK
ncbi:Hypothetical_protein [Hexamita inflata]|uniref:Hypothetical_protein n=1 Tax=Hexamita inflata TaxID=28002 RepID=A0AA86RRZ3_9EUKA|nr:Hypothetical protein HINF_LOCUS64584 [Hexamita inflata]